MAITVPSGVNATLIIIPKVCPRNFLLMVPVVAFHKISDGSVKMFWPVTGSPIQVGAALATKHEGAQFRSRIQLLVDSIVPAIPDFDAQVSPEEQLARAVTSLPEEYQSVMLLWAVEELSYKEIAESLDVPLGTVMSRLFRARKKLSEQLHDFAVEQGILHENGPRETDQNRIGN